MPRPSSDVATREGVICNRKGRLTPVLESWRASDLISCLARVPGLLTRVEVTVISSRLACWVSVESL